MKTLYLCFYFLKKGLLFNLLVIFQVFLAILWFSQGFSNWVLTFTTRDALAQLEAEHGYVFTPVSDLDTPSDFFFRTIEPKLLQSSDMGIVYEMAAEKWNLLAYNDTIIHHYRPRLAEGIWFDAYEQQDASLIPVVVTPATGLNIHQTISIGSNQTAIVIGILPPLAQYLSMTAGTEDPDSYLLGYLFNDPRQGQQANVILPYSQLDAVAQQNYGRTLSVLLFPHEQADAPDLPALTQNYGQIISMAQAQEQYEAHIKQQLSFDIPMFFIFLLAAIIGIGGTTMIQTIRNKKIFTIYYLTGMSQRHALVVEVLRIAMMILINMCIIWIFGSIGLWEFIFMPLWLRSYIYLIALVFLLLIYYGSSLFFILQQRKYSVIEMLRQQNRE